MTLLPAAFSQLKMIINLLGLIIVGAVFNLDAGFDSKHNRKLVRRLKCLPNIKENPRGRKKLSVVVNVFLIPLFINYVFASKELLLGKINFAALLFVGNIFILGI